MSDNVFSGIYLSLLAIFLFAVVKRKYKLAIFIFIFFADNSLSLLPMKFTRSLVMISLASYVLFNARLILCNIHKDKIMRCAAHLCIYFLFSIFLSITYYGVPVNDAFIAGWGYMLFLSIFIFAASPVNEKDFKDILTIIFYITLPCSVLYIIQSLTGKAILPLSWYQKDVPLIVANIHRFWITPPFMHILIFISIFCKKIIPKSFLSKIAPVVFLAGYFCTMYRTHIFVTLLCIFILMYMNGSIKKFCRAFFVLLVIYMLFAATFTERVARNNSTSDDIKAVFAGNFSSTGPQAQGGLTLLYRIAWCLERLDYVGQRPVELLFGLPQTDDSKWLNKRYNFYFGLINRETGLKDQTYTSDIGYGLMITKYGLVGSFLLIRLYLLLLMKLYKYRHSNELALTMFVYWLTRPVSMLAAPGLANPFSWIEFLFFYAYAMKLTKNTPSS